MLAEVPVRCGRKCQCAEAGSASPLRPEVPVRCGRKCQCSDMAEYSQTGLLAALLLFTSLTLRDLSRTGTEPVHTGNVLRFQYCKVYQEYSRAISQLYPDIRIEGENYPPAPFNRCLGSLMSYLKVVSILLIVSGQNVFAALGVDTPRAWTWSQDNKIFSCLMAFFFCNMLETHFLSTGAFEVTLNDVPVWSKLQAGYVPNLQEIFQILNNHLKINQEPTSFP
ncbi:selenoprotein T2 [Scomber scombrus]|uniref:Selenoprotein T n=1 Tax=Scomber scombrus TaxID=13677 RepID=A0AAV1QD47_SCOSC